jgi:hypothetical protein
MRHFIVGCFALAVSFGVATAVQAAPPKASTQELPAALKNMQPNQARILTTEQALGIRGQGGRKFGPHHPAIKFPANHYTGNRTGQDLKRGALK